MKQYLTITSNEFRNRLFQFLIENLEFEHTLNIRLLLTCAVDGGETETLVAEDTLTPFRHFDKSNLGVIDLSVNKMDDSKAFSTPYMDSPSLTMLKCFNKTASMIPNILSAKLPLASLCQLMLRSQEKKTSNLSEQLTAISPNCLLDFPKMQLPSPESHNSINKKRMAPYRRRCVKYPWLGRQSIPIVKKPKQFDCNQCGDVFSQLMELTKHTDVIHGGFKCKVCQARFSLRSNLQRHSYRHVDLKPFSCGVCKVQFYRKELLLDHIIVNHPKENVGTNVITHLTSAECLVYVETIWEKKFLADASFCNNEEEVDGEDCFEAEENYNESGANRIDNDEENETTVRFF